MSGIQVHLERRVEAPPALVWAVLTDLDRAEHTLSGVTGIERLGGPDYGVGTRWRETRTMFGKDSTEEMEVVEVVPGRSTVIAAESHGMRYRTAFTVTPSEGATLLGFDFSGEQASSSWWTSLLATLTAPLGRAATRKAMTQDLADIAAAAEQG